jgi:hypothetical protein
MPGTGVALGAIVGVGNADVGVLVGGLPAAMAVFEGIFSKANTITPMTIILRMLDFLVMSFLLLDMAWMLAAIEL